MSAVTEVQEISTSTVDTTALISGGDNLISQFLEFRLQYGSELTGWISANPPSSPGDCAAVAPVIRIALENLSYFYQVAVSASVASPSQVILVLS